MTFHDGMLQVYGVARAMVRGFVYGVVAVFFTPYGADLSVFALGFLLGYSTSVILQRLEKRADKSCKELEGEAI